MGKCKSLIGRKSLIDMADVLILLCVSIFFGEKILMFNELMSLYKSDEYPLHMPGHKRENGFGQLGDAIKIDITEIDGYDDLYDASGIIREALDRVTRIYNSSQSYFLVNGSTVGILTAIFACTSDAGKVLVARNCHKSVYHGIEIRNLIADFIDPGQVNGIFNPVSSKDIEKFLSENDYEAVIITSPTYEGKVSDIKEIASVCHRYSVPLIVDEAHGAHFVFSDRFPESAVNYADIVIESTHKTLPAMTQTGLLHFNSKLVDKEKIEKYLQIFQTSSPSYVLMTSIDECMKELEAKGEKLWDDFFENVSNFRDKVSHLKHLRVLDVDDSCKIVVSTAGTNINGVLLQKTLLEKYHLQLEMASATYVIAIVTCNDSKEGFERFAEALVEIDSEISDEQPESEKTSEFDHLLDTKAGDYIYIYPPGIPIAVPGQCIDENILNTIKEYYQAGLKVRGI